jgi:acetylornithine deacetylase
MSTWALEQSRDGGGPIVTLSPTQARVLAAYDQTEMISLAMDLARIPSFTTHETPVAHFLADFLRGHEIAVSLQEVEPGRFQCIGQVHGRGSGRSLMLNGHTDVDPLRLGWRRDPWRPSVEGDRIFGHGLFNMKAGVAAMIEAVLALRRAGIPLRGDIVIAAVVGELQGGVGTLHLLEHGPRTDAAIVAEPYGARNVITVHAGRWQAAITTFGKARFHGDREGAADAIAAMVDVMNAVKSVRFTGGAWDKVPGIPRLNVGSIVGGHGADADIAGAYDVADVCTIIVDVRFGPAQSPESITTDLRLAIEPAIRRHPGVRFDIVAPPPERFRNTRHTFPAFDLPLAEPLVGVVSQSIQAVTGEPPETVGAHLPMSRASDDTGHLWKAGIPCVLYGPLGSLERSDDADGSVPIGEMEISAKVMALSCLEFCV